jgi:zinc transporter ZupT
MTLLSAVLAVALMAVHLLAGSLRRASDLSGSTWLSAAGGIAAAYVFLHILPDLAAHQQTLGQKTNLGPDEAERLVFLSAFAGLVVFYGLERFATGAKGQLRQRSDMSDNAGAPFWIHLGSFGLYNLLIGYLLVHREASDAASQLLYFVAMATHFLAIDASLRRHHQARYDRVGRWIVAGAVLAGWALASFARLPDLALSLMFAFLAGGIILNVLKEELPEERQGRFLPFILGATVYSLILMAV